MQEKIKRVGSALQSFLQKAQARLQMEIAFQTEDEEPFKNYIIGDQVYYNGEFWNCITASTSNEPESSSQYWENADIPYRFRDFLVNAISCDFLRSEARFEEAEVLNNMAEIAVQQQIDVLLRQQGQVQRMNMAYTY